MCFKIKFCKNAIHDDITRRGGGEEGREGGGGDSCPKIIIQTFHCREICQ